MFGTIEPTPYDLHFKAFGIPVRVSPWFWVAGVVLGYDTIKIGVDFLVAWLLVLFVSILVHELGHALLARRFGYPPRILLYQFGGLAMYEPYRDYTRSKAIAISLAGPGAGFLLYGIVTVFVEFGLGSLVRLPDRMLEVVVFTIGQLIWVNLWWGVLNLLPVLPLDGGQICREVCSIWSPIRGLTNAARIGAVVAGLAAAFFFARQETYVAILFALLCAQNISILQQRGGW